MTRQDLNVRIAAIVTTLAETDGGPESILYLGLGMDMDLWQRLRQMLVQAGIITVASYYVRLTPKGQTLASQLTAAMAKTSSSAPASR